MVVSLDPMPTDPSTLPSLPLPEIADALIGTNSPAQLVERLGHLLTSAAVTPARLFLLDPSSMSYYGVAAWGCELGDDELDASDVLLGEVPGALALTHRGDPIGVLVVDPAQADSPAAGAIAAILGPVLDASQEREQTLDELRRLHERIGHLLDAGKLLQHIDLESLLVEVLQTSLTAVQAEVGAVLVAEGDGDPEIKVTWGLQDHHVRGIRLADGGGAVTDLVHTKGEALRVASYEVADCLDCSDLAGHLTGLLVLPLRSETRNHGVILLANPADDFDGESQQVAETVARLASIAIDNAILVRAMVEQERLERELDIARQVQDAMFPDSGLESGPCVVEGAFRSCDETGGDYYTHIERDGHLVAVIADVTGHGLGAALFTTIAHAMIQQQLQAGHSLDAVYTVLNQGLYLTRSGRFMTSAMVEIDHETLAMRYASAGHNSLLLVRKDGSVSWLESGGMPLGILASATTPLDEGHQLAEGDCLVLYTDGITEAMNHADECYGEDRLAELVVAARADGMQAKPLIDHIFSAVDTWAGDVPIGDDLTLVVVDVTGATHAEQAAD